MRAFLGTMAVPSGVIAAKTGIPKTSLHRYLSREPAVRG